METWLALTDYSSKYKVSVSTLRRRIKAEDIKYLFQEGKYFIFDEPIKNAMKMSPSLNFSSVPLEAYDDESLDLMEEEASPVLVDQVHNQFQKSVSESSYDPDFLETLRRSASVKLPQVKNQTGALSSSSAAKDLTSENYKDSTQKSVDSEVAASRDFSSKIAKIGNNEPILTAANKLLNELKKAYGQILQEKEEQMILLKEDVSDLRTLVKVLEKENEKLRVALTGHDI